MGASDTVPGVPVSDSAGVGLSPTNGTGSEIGAPSALLNGLSVAAGRGSKRGAKLGVIDHRDVAPTLAHLLGQKLPNADGKVCMKFWSE